LGETQSTSPDIRARLSEEIVVIEKAEERKERKDGRKGKGEAR